MNNRDMSSFIGLVIGLIIAGILLPIGINQIYDNPIQKSEITSLNDTNKTSLLLNGTDTGLYNGSILQPSFTNYTDIIYNTTLSRSENFSVRFTISCNNTSDINNTIVEIILNGGTPQDFNVSTFNTTFQYNQLYISELNPITVVEIKIRIYAVIISNISLSSDAEIIQYYTDETTETISSLYYIIPLMAVVSIVLMMVKSKSGKN